MISILSDPLAQAHLEATLALLELGGGTPVLRVYRTDVPSSSASHSDTPMATLEFPNPSGTISGATLTLAATTSTLVLASGLPRWAELVAANGVVLHIGDVTDSVGDGFYKASGADTPPGETSPYFTAGGLLSLGPVVLT